MTDEPIDLSGELSRAEEAAAGGIEVRAILFEMDDDDEQLIADDGDDGDASDGDDEVVEDEDAAPVDA